MNNQQNISQMGYKDNSPYRDRSYIDIITPNGKIDMSETGIPLLANGRYLPAYSGTHQFYSNVVREVPIGANRSISLYPSRRRPMSRRDRVMSRGILIRPSSIRKKVATTGKGLRRKLNFVL